MDMVGRVGFAIAKARRAAEGQVRPSELYDELARAAIAAMREPTDAMVYTAEWEYVNFGKATYLRDLYRTMIDVSLGQREPQSLQGKQFDESGSVIP